MPLFLSFFWHPLQSLMFFGCLMFSHHHWRHLIWAPISVYQCLMFFLLLPQANGCISVDFGCTHPIDVLFWCLPIYLLGFLSKYKCWVTDLIMQQYDNDENLPIINKSKHSKIKGEYKEQNGRVYVQEDQQKKEGKGTSISWTSCCPKKSISNKERGGPLERTPNQQELSPFATTHLQIEITCACL